MAPVNQPEPKTLCACKGSMVTMFVPVLPPNHIANEQLCGLSYMFKITLGAPGSYVDDEDFQLLQKPFPGLPAGAALLKLSVRHPCSDT